MVADHWADYVRTALCNAAWNSGAGDVFQALLAMEMQGLALRGAFEHAGRRMSDHEIEWCERRILQRIHRLTLGTLRKQIEPVTPAVYMRWLLGWQHLAPQTQLAGEEGVLEALSQLEGFEAPAVEWERTLLPARVAELRSALAGRALSFGCCGLGPGFAAPGVVGGEGSAPRRVIPTNAAPITFFVRESADWLPHALAAQCVDESTSAAGAQPGGAGGAGAAARSAALALRTTCSGCSGFTRQQTQHALVGAGDCRPCLG